MKEPMRLFEKVAIECARQFRLPVDSMHGLPHWRRVLEIGLYLSRNTGADIFVVALFSCLHDSQRENDADNPMHGKRAAEYAQKLFDQHLLEISEDQFEVLSFACTYHNDPDAASNDVTIQTCWDADRLDLYRLGETPNDNFLYTRAAKAVEAKKFASGLSVDN